MGAKGVWRARVSRIRFSPLYSGSSIVIAFIVLALTDSGIDFMYS